MTPRNVVILGSTGSIGTQAIDVARQHPDLLRIVGIGAGGAQPKLLAEQAVALKVEVVAIADSTAFEDLQLHLYAAAKNHNYAAGEFRMPKVLAGPKAMTDLASWSADTVLNGMTGSIGLAPTLAALRAGSTLALANKESLIAGGALVREAAQPDQIVPVDSEHSALAQCLRAGHRDQVHKLILTASGGPFRGRHRSDLADITLDDALAHPTWDMGPVVTINSATMVNKALEVIEAHELFAFPYDDIDVVVHPQSVIHSLVEYVDGSTIAQASPPDMRLPISHALAWPDRLTEVTPPVDWTKAHSWTFQPLDAEAFPAVELAKAAGRTGGALPAIYNAANEEAVAAFRASRLPFLGIVDTIETVLTSAPDFGQPGTVEAVLEAESWARQRAHEVVANQT